MLLLYSHCTLPWRYNQTSMNFTRCAFHVWDGGACRGGGGFLETTIFWGVLGDSQADMSLERSEWSLCFHVQEGNQRAYSSITLCSLCFKLFGCTGLERSTFCHCFSISNHYSLDKTSIIDCCSVRIPFLLFLSLKRKKKKMSSEVIFFFFIFYEQQ